ncbi:hypothetical protein GOV14_04430 [Candidatus Pacearchaeota archaeon]|nr:hypothetical protein [Candidatus Pacearchaeota archaeon]
MLVVLIVAAILLSVVSIAVTISTLNTKMIPKLNPITIPDESTGKVSLIINEPPVAPAE